MHSFDPSTNIALHSASTRRLLGYKKLTNAVQEPIIFTIFRRFFTLVTTCQNKHIEEDINWIIVKTKRFLS